LKPGRFLVIADAGVHQNSLAVGFDQQCVDTQSEIAVLAKRLEPFALALHVIGHCFLENHRPRPHRFLLLHARDFDVAYFPAMHFPESSGG
jgi:hypothetical protein